MAIHTGRWQATPLRASLEEAIEMLIYEFGWTLQPIE
jgi:hypothetical protein